METYIVKLWITDPDTKFRKQVVEEIDLKTDSKAAHEEAEKIALKKYAKFKPDIVSVKYV